MKKLLIIALIALSFVLAGCGDGEQSITEGAVVVDELVEKCTDSDGGVNTAVQGVVSVEDEDYADECVAGFLIEYYCDGDNVVNQNMRCPDGCTRGKCT